MSKSILNILIIEDNISIALDLEIMVKDLGHKLMGTIDNSAQALDTIFAKTPDLILMDIDIKGTLNGIEIGQKIKHMDIPIIFITGHDEQDYYNNASKTNIAGYIVKPPKKLTLRSIIDGMINERNNSNDNNNDIAVLDNDTKEKTGVFDESIFIKKKKAYHKVYTKDIQYAEASGNYSTIMTGGEKVISNFTLKQMEAMLPPTLFIKVHRSFIINLNYFDSINVEENTIQMADGSILPISRNNKQKILDRMKLG